MRIYWDTSAAINALVSPPVKDRLYTNEHYYRTHLFSEFFSIMTGRGILVKDPQGSPVRFRLCASDAASWLRNFAGKVQVIDLDSSEILDAFKNAQSKGISGPHVYDYGHALAADKAKAEVILTRNMNDFQGLSSSARLEWP